MRLISVKLKNKKNTNKIAGLFMVFCAVISATTNVYALSCNNGYYLSDGNCVDCGNGYYCNNNNRYSCMDINPHPNLSFATSVVDGVWKAVNAWDPSQCTCYWHFSDDRRIQYMNEHLCALGPGGNTFTHYSHCRSGYYAIDPLFYNDWYNDCAPCTNKPANSRYIGYSKPSVMYAVEDNCPWKCDDGYSLTSSGICAQICVGGIKSLKTNGLTIPLYETKQTTPSLNIQTATGVCYVSLAPGASSDAININYSGNIYHTIK